MKHHKNQYTLTDPFRTVTLANWNKYPNQYSEHVLSVDVLERRVDPSTGIMTTDRLVCCKQPVPKLARRVFPSIPEVTYFLETSILDPAKQTYRAVSTNLTGQSFLNVEETCELTADQPSRAETTFRQTASVNAMGALSWVGGLVEDAAVSAYKANADKGRAGLEGVVKRFKEEFKSVERDWQRGVETLGSNAKVAGAS